jgi:1-acyl-sn-glycerol-3-phosphate acyltransferase
LPPPYNDKPLMIRATCVYLFVSLYVLLLAPFALTYSFLSNDTRIFYALGRFCIRFAGLLCGVRVQIRGLEKISPTGTYLFVSNHQGNFDAPVLYHVVPQDALALIKQEMMRLPILSIVMRRARFVPIERHDAIKARAAIDAGAELLREGHSFLAFPEGTRSRNGRLGEFKKGVFIMALKAAVPIVPISILNSSAIQPPGSYGIRSGTITVVIHDSIPTEGVTIENRDRLVRLARDRIASVLPEEL